MKPLGVRQRSRARDVGADQPNGKRRTVARKCAPSVKVLERYGSAPTLHLRKGKWRRGAEHDYASCRYNVATPLTIDSRWRRLAVVLFPALLVPLQLLLFGPHTIYAGNVQEFSAPFWNLVVHLVPMILRLL